MPRPWLWGGPPRRPRRRRRLFWLLLAALLILAFRQIGAGVAEVRGAHPGPPLPVARFLPAAGQATAGAAAAWSALGARVRQMLPERGQGTAP